ncbi:PIR Superfamily Protein [Plasmodium ovale wallikeri]|uniref:PIR Superfamily Protein n=1 Tax=Plasmodium ovale wallikeri TaxID=864142 RepID=A0A1A9AHG3_PLAOA|nr:PIR Superfamily Protein [Plasmodium ovale wallikeri]SBT56020.1 PIR Superfamily Protein [Plasmodium ovale wallikeri]
MSYKCDNVLSKLSCHENLAQEQANAKVPERPDAMKHTSASGAGTEVCPLSPVATGSATGFEIEVTPKNSEISTKVGYSVIAVAPVLLTATALYRYTPVGSWVRCLGIYNPNSINDLNGYSTNTEASGDMRFDVSENYISYQSM